MRIKYNMRVMSNKEFKNLTGELPEFRDGFIRNKTVDYMKLLENEVREPIIRVICGRESWNEILIVSVDGYIKDDAIYIKGNLDTCKEILQQIFLESENDEYEVFEQYSFPDLTSKEKKELKKWIQTTY